MHLSLIEHEKIKIGSRNDPVNKQISQADADYLQSVETISGSPIFKWGNKTLIAQQWVGVISTPNISIEVMPKIANTSTVEEIRDKLVKMLLLVNNVSSKETITSSLSYGTHGFIDVLASIFLRKLEKEVLRGIILSYEKVSNNLQAVKGSIDFTQHINKNAMVESKFFCKYSKMTKNHLINQTIKYTLALLNRVVRTNLNKIMIKKLSLYFEDVEDVAVTLDDVEKIQYHRNNIRYSEIIDYCKIFISGTALELRVGFVKLNFLMFDMNKLYQEFIYKSLKRILKDKIYRAKTSYLLTNRSNGAKKAKLIPDIFYRINSNKEVVIDTKWKIVEKFASEKDLYQMNAYMSVFNDVEESILLYPKDSKNDKIIGDYVVNCKGKPFLLKVRTVDISLIGTSGFNAHLISSIH